MRCQLVCLGQLKLCSHFHSLFNTHVRPHPFTFGLAIQCFGLLSRLHLCPPLGQTHYLRVIFRDPLQLWHFDQAKMLNYMFCRLDVAHLASQNWFRIYSWCYRLCQLTVNSQDQGSMVCLIWSSEVPTKVWTLETIDVRNCMALSCDRALILMCPCM